VTINGIELNGNIVLVQFSLISTV